MQGLYGVYYTGVGGAAALGLLLYEGKVHGIDPAGGEINGTYLERADGGLDLTLLFSWPTGGVMVTGQVLTQPMTVPAHLTISAATLAGGDQLIDLPIGRVNVRVRKKVAI